MKTNINDCVLLTLAKIHNRAGNITIIENSISIPFDIKRVYYLYDVPGGAERGGHAHRNLEQLIVSASGAFDVILSDGNEEKTIRLDTPSYGIYIKCGIWRELKNFSSGAICLVLASDYYKENDYIRNYKDFIKYKNSVK